METSSIVSRQTADAQTFSFKRRASKNGSSLLFLAATQIIYLSKSQLRGRA
jgi:hypothetical protein